jgi:hypothetical protein
MSHPAYHLRLADLFDAGESALMARYGGRVHPRQRQAMAAIRDCRSGSLGELAWRCPDCTAERSTPRSCGHRSCPACSNHTTSQWLDRQRRKLLPVDYFMVTFTLPAQLRPAALAQPEAVYSALFRAASDTLKGFAHRKLKAELGQCAVLHTHNRRLDLHPHVHIVVPGGGIDDRRRQWRKLKGRYLFNAFALARVFRARLLHALHEAGVASPAGLPPKWVVDCRRVGRGEPALLYLSRFLYRGVIRERDLIDYDRSAGSVTFRYLDAQTGQPAYRGALTGEHLTGLAGRHRRCAGRVGLQPAQRQQGQARVLPEQPAHHAPCHHPSDGVAYRVGARAAVAAYLPVFRDRVPAGRGVGPRRPRRAAAGKLHQSAGGHRSFHGQPYDLCSAGSGE